ncbi:phage integrase N-terminal domain-containing protein [Hydrogenophaga sp. NFH-34]|uniref:phage integrase N-terminal domain-containing protein n=1 Tax=Hydrogenophaga sp. NFH-34 TaxID=2744446 RepID=UPI001F2B5F21|nr:phage integrase N-terminal domain-containing protein [Hydrogenophaga sp. NFH-34]
MDGAKTKALIASMEAVCESHGRVRLNGAMASERTYRIQMEVMKNFARTLHDAGFMLEDCRNLGAKHVDAVFDAWVAKGNEAKTLQNQKSRVKQFLRWLVKPELVNYVAQIEKRYPEQWPEGFKVRTIADRSKSERGVDVDVNELIRRALRNDSRHGAMLMMERAFGLRRKEVMLSKLWKADKGDRLELIGSVTKNGRPRVIELEPGEYGRKQREYLDYAKSLIKRTESLAWPDLTLKQAERRYYGCNDQIGLTKSVLGITGHSLRAGFAEDLMLLAGLLPASLGGTKEMSDKEVRRRQKLKTSEALGHSRLVITHAYYGQDQRLAKAGELLGYKFGPPIVGHGIDGRVVLWVSERPEPADDVLGQYRLPGEKAELAVVTAQFLRGDVETDRMSVSQFLQAHEGAAAELEMRLNLLGLTLIDEEGRSA